MSEAKTGGKKRSEHRQKGRVVPFRVSPEEYAHLKWLAERERLTLGSYVRDRALPKLPSGEFAPPTTRARRRPVVEQAVLSQLVAQIGKSGGLLNQIARRINQGEAVTQREIQAALAEHRQILAAVIVALGRG